MARGIDPQELDELLDWARGLPREQLGEEVLATLRAVDREAELLLRDRKQNRLKYLQVTPKQLAMMNATQDHDEVGGFAGNQSGKSTCASALVAMHLLGEYPEKLPVILGTHELGQAPRLTQGQWIERGFEVREGVGRVGVERIIEMRPFTPRMPEDPPLIWTSSYSGEKIKETLQRQLFGRLLEGGEQVGWVPWSRILTKSSAALGVSHLLESATVRHSSGGVSEVVQKFAKKGVDGYTGSTVWAVLLDEEHPVEIYMEALARITATGGFVLFTYTPTSGRTPLYDHFDAPPRPVATRKLVRMSLWDATFYSAARQQRIADRWPQHQRQARIEGFAAVGTGAVLPYAREHMAWHGDEADLVDMPNVRWGVGLDFGMGGESGHPRAAVLCAETPDGTVYVTRAVKTMAGSHVTHAAEVRKWAADADIPVFWPHDGLKRVGTGEQSETIAELYSLEGVPMWTDSARYYDHVGGGMGDGTFISVMTELIEAGRLKVAAGLEDWFGEQQEWHYRDGKIVDRRDDLIKATKSAIIMRRHWALRRHGRTNESRVTRYEISSPI